MRDPDGLARPEAALAGAGAALYAGLDTGGLVMLCRAILFAAVSALPASANEVEKILTAGGGNSCWERTYDAARLASHPKQQVVNIRLSAESQDDGSVVAQLGINLRQRTGEGGKHDYTAFGYCKAKGARTTCSPEWDAGSFTIEMAKGGVLVKNRGIIANPSNYDSEDISDKAVNLGKSDDKAWLLQRSNDESCGIY